jgi:tetratricopeptide (TPR) repeat protein
MPKGFVGLALVGMLVTPPTVHAQDAVANRVQGAMDTRMVQPDCKLDNGDFRVSSGRTYLKTGIEGSGDPSNRTKALKNGVRVVTEAVSTTQAKSSAAWYWLGRLYLQQGDLLGADSAFAKAQVLAPGCKEDIRKYRYRAWATLVNAGSAFRQSNQADSALEMYRGANLISQEGPLSYANMAEMFSTAKQTDSAVYYFGKAAATTPTDPQQIKLRDQASFNYAVLLLTAGKAREAVDAFRNYLVAVPDDASGRKGLAQAFRAAGMTDSAQAVERQLVAGDTEGVSAGAAEGLSDDDLMDIGVRQFNEKSYKEAAVTFHQVVARNAWNRNALFNLANAYLAQRDGSNLIATADKLIALEPLAEYDHSLRIEGYKLTKDQKALLAASGAKEALLVNLEIEAFRATGDGATLTGKLTGREARDLNNKVIPAKPQTVTVEFLSLDGTAVATQDVQIGPLKVGENAAFQAAAKGAGIKAWRYRVW